MELQKVIKDFEEETNHRVVYITKSGSKLYGTDTPKSDTDYKGIFIPDKRSVLLQKDLKSFSNDTNNTKEKNTAEDIDFSLHSIYGFFNQLESSETGGVDVLFSMFRPETIAYEDKEFTELIKMHYKSFMNRNMKSFIGYALGQSKKFGIKGARYDELDRFVNIVRYMDKDGDTRLETIFPELEAIIKKEDFGYIEFKMAPGSRGSGIVKEVMYLTILGKMFSGTVTIDYFMERVELLYNQFGNRTKTVAKTLTKTDWKALSHSLRIAKEVKELLTTGFIKFPLADAVELREIKEGNADVEETIEKIQQALAEVDDLLLESDLQEKSDRELMDDIILDLIK